jgi:hypothetical protein
MAYQFTSLPRQRTAPCGISPAFSATRREAAFHRALRAKTPSPVSGVEPPAHLGLVLALDPLVLVNKSDEADERAGRPVLHGPQPEAVLVPVADETRDLRLALLPSERSAAADVLHSFGVGADTRVKVQILALPPAQQEPPGFDFVHLSWLIAER